MRPKTLLAWSSGKDSAYALVETLRLGQHEVVGLLTTLTEKRDRVAIHGVRETLLDRQLERLGLPCSKVRLPFPCPNEIYEREVGHALLAAKRSGVTHVIFGDLYLQEIREYRERQLTTLGLHSVFPLWGRDTAQLARDMLADGVEATLSCVNPKQLAASHVGMRLNETFLQNLPEQVDPCGENGEFHTFVSAGPMFSRPIDIEVGPVHEQDGFVYADLSEAR